MKTKKSFFRSGLAATAVIACCLVGLVFGDSIATVRAQNDMKMIELAATINPQIKFTRVKIGQEELEFDKPFQAKSDWVKEISFQLENRAGKPIVFLQVNVNFPETRATGNLMSYTVSFGEHPKYKLKDRQPLMLKPEQTLEVSLEKEREKISRFLYERQPIEQIQKVELEIGLIIFEDKTAWSSGNFMRPDANNPGRYLPLEKDLQR